MVIRKYVERVEIAVADRRLRLRGAMLVKPAQGGLHSGECASLDHRPQSRELPFEVKTRGSMPAAVTACRRVSAGN